MSIDPSFAPPNETSQGIWIEVSTFVGDTVLGATAFGILASLYVLSLSALIPQLKKPAHKNWAIFHIAYASLLLILIGIGTAGNARLAQLYWINNRNFDGGPLAFIEDETSISILRWGWSVYIVASWLQDAYVVYRCLVFWGRNYLVCALPILCFIGSVASAIAVIVEISTAGLTSPLAIKFAICWYIFSVSINILATLAIVGRLLWKRKTIIALLGKEHSRIYTGVVSMFIESAAIYSVFGIIFIGSYFRQDPVNNIVLPILGTLEGICPLLIIYRVANGRGWTNKTMQQVTTYELPTLQYDMPDSMPGGKPTHSATLATKYSSTQVNSASNPSLEKGDTEEGKQVKVEREIDVV